MRRPAPQPRRELPIPVLVDGLAAALCAANVAVFIGLLIMWSPAP